MTFIRDFEGRILKQPYFKSGKADSDMKLKGHELIGSLDPPCDLNFDLTHGWLIWN